MRNDVGERLEAPGASGRREAHGQARPARSQRDPVEAGDGASQEPVRAPVRQQSGFAYVRSPDITGQFPQDPSAVPRFPSSGECMKNGVHPEAFTSPYKGIRNAVLLTHGSASSAQRVGISAGIPIPSSAMDKTGDSAKPGPRTFAEARSCPTPRTPHTRSGPAHNPARTGPDLVHLCRTPALLPVARAGSPHSHARRARPCVPTPRARPRPRRCGRRRAAAAERS